MNIATGFWAIGLFKVRIPGCGLWKCFQVEMVSVST